MTVMEGKIKQEKKNIQFLRNSHLCAMGSKGKQRFGFPSH